MPDGHLPPPAIAVADQSPAGANHAATIRLLTFSTLYPSAARPNHGVFVENRLRHLIASGQAVSTVLAPVPWFPFTAPRWGEWSKLAATPRAEMRHGLRVLHPRFAALPRVGMTVSPLLLYQGALAAIRQLQAEGLRVDLIDAHYLYPDGVAAVWLGRRLGLPVVITARGSDTSLLPRYAIPRRLIRGAIAGADALIAVSAGLREGLLELGAPPDKVTVLRNGVDLGLFRPPADRAAARAALGIGAGPTLVSVGLLIARKQHHLTIDALRSLPDHTLVLVGEGPERAALHAHADRIGVADRVRFVGAQPHARLPLFYGAADCMVLASSREGWANVLLESMACGTSVVTTPAWGSREAVSVPEAGLVLAEASAAAIAAGVRQVGMNAADRALTRAHAERFGWEETTAGQLALFRGVLATRRARPV